MTGELIGGLIGGLTGGLIGGLTGGPGVSGVQVLPEGQLMTRVGREDRHRLAPRTGQLGRNNLQKTFHHIGRPC